MKAINILLWMLVLPFFFATSCGKDDKECDLNDALIPCNLDIDKSIKFDTMWLTPLSYDYNNQHFTDKYVILERREEENPGRFFEVFSLESGELIASIEPGDIPDFSAVNFSFYGDFLRYVNYDDNLFSYNFITRTIKSHELEKLTMLQDIVYGTDHYYIIDKSIIAEYDYDGNLTRELPGLAYSPDIRPTDIMTAYYNGPAVLNRKILAYMYSEFNDKHPWMSAAAITLIDLSSGKIERHFKFPSTIEFHYFNVNSEMLLARASNFIFAFDFKTGKEYFRKVPPKYSGYEVYAFPPLVSQRGNIQSMVFFNNPHLSAEGFESGKLLWDCIGVSGIRMNLVYLTRENGDIDHYLGFAHSGKFHLADIHSGVIKTQYDLSNLPNSIVKNLKALDEKGIFLNITSNSLIKVETVIQ